VEDIADTKTVNVGVAILDDLHRFLCRKAVGDQRANHRTGAGADVNIKVVDIVTNQHFVNGTERTHFIHAAS
jgi:hypothetical protein